MSSSDARQQEASRVRVRAPGRVNLIGDHTDYTGGLVLPAAIDRFVDIDGAPGGDVVVLTSDEFDEPARVSVTSTAAEVASVQPPWARFVAGVVAELRPVTGFTGTVTSSVPAGAGLSSSAALELAVAVALGAPTEDPVALARLAQRAEHLARGVPTGIMDQLACAAGRDAHALLIDCATPSVTPVPLPLDVQLVVFHSGQARDLAASAYAQRVAECAAAEVELGPLRTASVDDVERLTDPLLRRRARHVVTENARVRAAAAALTRGDSATFGRLMLESHASLRDDYEVSTPAVDELVVGLAATPGVLGARLTGAGFGGCVVALTRPGTNLSGGWPVRAVDGVRRLVR
ncbi:MAG: galactokinase [Ilumatobacteraceae bacterium]